MYEYNVGYYYSTYKVYLQEETFHHRFSNRLLIWIEICVTGETLMKLYNDKWKKYERIKKESKETKQEESIYVLSKLEESVWYDYREGYIEQIERTWNLK